MPAAGIPSEVLRIYASIGTEDQCIRCTDLYNEGWLLRLLLSAAFRGLKILPFDIQPHARWYSEGLLPTAFRPRSRGDRLGETATNADGAIGHFGFTDGTKAGLKLNSDATQFVVCEAKMFSKLSKKTTNAPDYNQATRSVACIAQMLSEAGRPVETYTSLGFFVLAPESELRHRDFQEKVNREAIRNGIVQRVNEYRSEPCYVEFKSWLDQWAVPLVDRIELGCHSWESLLHVLRAADAYQHKILSDFYGSCLLQR